MKLATSFVFSLTICTSMLAESSSNIGAASSLASEPVMIIAGSQKSVSFDQRLRLLGKLKSGMTVPDREVLFRFLGKTFDQDYASRDELDALKNDVADVLLTTAVKLSASEVVEWLAMVDAPTQGVVWRNYVVQKLDDVWRLAEDEDSKRAVYNKLIACTGSKEITIPATALLTLSRMKKDASISDSDLGGWAMVVVMDKDYPWQDKATALQIAAMVAHPGALPFARKFLADASTPVNLRMSALATLGMLGGREDLPSLNTNLKSSELRLQMAAKSALAKLKKRGVE